MKKSDIERLIELETEKLKRIHGRSFSEKELYITALDYNDEIIILRSKIQHLSESGIIVVINPDRAEKDGEIYQLIDLLTLKMIIFTYDKSEDEILELLEIVEESETDEKDEFYEV
ncbi:MAG: hypothetical protein ACTSRS_01775 [Candidatus Helarchaeota archaeon]